MDIQLKEVTTKKDLRKFILYPTELYKGNPYYVPSFYMDDVNTLSRDKNPVFEFAKTKYWLAYQDGKIVGRVAAILNPKAAQRWGHNYMRFGWLDFIDDIEVLKALMAAVEGWAKEEGTEGVQGPLGFTDLDREGMLVEGFEEMATLATYYNYPYYPKYLAALGYIKDVDWVEYEFTIPEKPIEKIGKAAELVSKRSNVRLFVPHSKKEIMHYARSIFEVLDEAYRNLFGVTPLTEKQVGAYIDQYLSLAVLDYVPLVLNDKDELIAFGVAFPSFSKALQKSKGLIFPFGWVSLLKAYKKNDRADLYLVGIKDEYRGKGVNALLMNQMMLAFQKNGIKKVESNPNLEDNEDVQAQWKYFERRQHKRRRCFIKLFA
jgi:GNAT superfamily N-acetyltransferase